MATKTRVLGFRATEAEELKLVAAAAKKHVKVGQYIKWHTFEAADRDAGQAPPEPRAA
jgi:hypothetical protein